MKKKILAALLTAVMTFSLAACGGEKLLRKLVSRRLRRCNEGCDCNAVRS
ncbi:MAG: hypothetical protein ACLTUZ_01105 [Sellimonas intestinalis]